MHNVSKGYSRINLKFKANNVKSVCLNGSSKTFNERTSQIPFEDEFDEKPHQCGQLIPTLVLVTEYEVIYLH